MMSRTYRKWEVAFCNNCDKPRTYKNCVVGEPEPCQCHWSSGAGIYIRIVKCNDGKPWYKPPKWFKQMNRQRFRAQVNQALHNHVYKGKDFIPPINKKTDVWEWT